MNLARDIDACMWFAGNVNFGPNPNNFFLSIKLWRYEDNFIDDGKKSYTCWSSLVGFSPWFHFPVLSSWLCRASTLLLSIGYLLLVLFYLVLVIEDFLCYGCYYGQGFMFPWQIVLLFFFNKYISLPLFIIIMLEQNRLCGFFFFFF